MLETLEGTMRRLERVSRTIAIVCLVVIMLIVVADVGARYLLNAPMAWSYDVIGMYLMPALFYLSLSDTLADHHHIAVDLLRPRMPVWLCRVVECLGALAMTGLFGLIAWIYGGSAIEKYQSGAVVMSVGQWPSWIPDAIVLVGSVTIALRLAGRAIGHALSLVTGRAVIELPASVEH